MSKHTKCGAMTTKGVQCKHVARYGDYCHIHRYLHKSDNEPANDRSKRLTELLAAGASLVFLVEKAVEYVPNLFELISYITPDYGSATYPYRTAEVCRDLKSRNLDKITLQARHLAEGLQRYRKYDQQSDMAKKFSKRDALATLPDELQVAILDTCAKCAYYASLLRNVD